MPKKYCVSSLFSERDIELILEIYRGLELYFGTPVLHRDFVEACRGAGFLIPGGVVKESLWVLATGVFLPAQDLTDNDQAVFSRLEQSPMTNLQLVPEPSEV